jgi:polyphosphate glucokinase
VAQITEHFDWDGRVGVTFPGVIMHGTCLTAANLDKSWIGVDVAKVFAKATKGLHFTAMNDADAAGVAEQAFGAAKDEKGLVVMLTLGTGIGSALLHNGALIPNMELGHLNLGLEIGDAEKYASEIVREREELSWEAWAGRLTEYFQVLENLVWPDLFVVGGGVSKHPEPWMPLIRCRTPIAPARLRNKAGIVGAALYAQRTHERHKANKG